MQPHREKESLFCALMYEDTCQKKKRGNKFPLEGKCIFGQLREKANEETNPKASRSSFGRARGMRKLPFEGNPPPINTPPHSSHFIHPT